MIPENAKKLLTNGLQTLGLEISQDQEVQLHRYLKVLEHWNKTFNLTAIRDFNDMVVHHLLDSFAIQPFFRSQLPEHFSGVCYDLGSGAGVPGIPLSIINPDLQWTLVDSNGKKIRFLRHVIREAGLKNVSVIQSRIEQLPGENLVRPLFITARALASTEEILALIRHFVKPRDKVLLMKGLKGPEEIGEGALDFAPFHIEEVKVPYLDASRCLLATEFRGVADTVEAADSVESAEKEENKK